MSSIYGAVLGLNALNSTPHSPPLQISSARMKTFSRTALTQRTASVESIYRCRNHVPFYSYEQSSAVLILYLGVYLGYSYRLYRHIKPYSSLDKSQLLMIYWDRVIIATCTFLVLIIVTKWIFLSPHQLLYVSSYTFFCMHVFYV